MATYRARLREIETGLGTRPDERWQSPHSHAWFLLDWNAQRLAVLDHDIEAIIRTHAKDRKVAAWLEDTAEAFEEIGSCLLRVLELDLPQGGRLPRSPHSSGYSDPQLRCSLLPAHGYSVGVTLLRGGLQHGSAPEALPYVPLDPT
jgi:hypothetical protein